MANYTSPPWAADRPGHGLTAIRDKDGDVVCLIPHKNSEEEVAGNAALVSLAPELFRSVHDLLMVMRKSDAEIGGTCSGEEWDNAVDDAEALLEMLAEDGVTIAEAANAP